MNAATIDPSNPVANDVRSAAANPVSSHVGSDDANQVGANLNASSRIPPGPAANPLASSNPYSSIASATFSMDSFPSPPHLGSLPSTCFDLDAVRRALFLERSNFECSICGCTCAATEIFCFGVQTDMSSLSLDLTSSDSVNRVVSGFLCHECFPAQSRQTLAKKKQDSETLSDAATDRLLLNGAAFGSHGVRSPSSAAVITLLGFCSFQSAPVSSDKGSPVAKGLDKFNDNDPIAMIEKIVDMAKTEKVLPDQIGFEFYRKFSNGTVSSFRVSNVPTRELLETFCAWCVPESFYERTAIIFCGKELVEIRSLVESCKQIQNFSEERKGVVIPIGAESIGEKREMDVKSKFHPLQLLAFSFPALCKNLNLEKLLLVKNKKKKKKEYLKKKNNFFSLPFLSF